MPLGISPVSVTLVGRSNITTLPKATGRDPALRNLLTHCHYVLEKDTTVGLQVEYCFGWAITCPGNQGRGVCAAG